MEEKLQQLLTLLEQAPDDPFVHFALAREYEKIEIYDKALITYNALLKKFPDYTGTYYHLGNLLERLGEREAAVNVYRIGIKITGEQGDGHALSELESSLSMAEQ